MLHSDILLLAHISCSPAKVLLLTLRLLLCPRETSALRFLLFFLCSNPDKLQLEDNTNAIYSIAQERLFTEEAKLFSCGQNGYDSVLGIWRWGVRKLQRMVNTCSKITGVSQLSLSDLYNRNLFRKATSILANAPLVPVPLSALWAEVLGPLAGLQSSRLIHS